MVILAGSRHCANAELKSAKRIEFKKLSEVGLDDFNLLACYRYVVTKIIGDTRYLTMSGGEAVAIISARTATNIIDRAISLAVTRPALLIAGVIAGRLLNLCVSSLHSLACPLAHICAVRSASYQSANPVGE